MVERLGPSEAVRADKACVGAEPRFPRTTLYVPVKKPPGGERTPEETRPNRTLASVRIVIEHFFARLNRFGALAQIRRYRRAVHSAVFRVAASLAGCQIGAAAAWAKCARTRRDEGADREGADRRHRDSTSHLSDWTSSSD